MSYTWEELKNKGSAHYKTKGLEPIDLWKDIKPHHSLSVFAIKALTDNMKYSFRMLVAGANQKDCDKIIHYAELLKASMEEDATKKA